MKSITFPEANSKLALVQPEFKPLPVHIKALSENWYSMTAKFELSPMEIAQIVLTKSFYVTQHCHRFNPIIMQVENAFSHALVEYEEKEDGGFEAWTTDDSGVKQHFSAPSADTLLSLIISYYPGLEAENICFAPKPLLALDKDGNLVENEY